MSDFIHLHTHSHYSLLSALPKVDELVRAAKAQNMGALALTDNGNLYGAIEFYKTCKKSGIKPIIGVDFYLAERTRHDKQHGIDNRRHRLVLLAKNIEGYKNLIKLVTRSNLEGFYYRPRIDKELLEQLHGGLLCIVPSFSSSVGLALRAADEPKAKELLAWYKELFGSDSVYLETSHHPELDGHADLQRKIYTLANTTGTPLLAGQEVFYLNPEDRAARNTLVSIQNSAPTERDQGEETDFSFISDAQALEWFKDIPEAVENSRVIADMCNLELELGKWMFPDVKLTGKNSYDGELRSLVYAGIARRNLSETPQLTERIEYELNIIKNKGYAPYFLVVADLLHFAHSKDILTTIRGSVGGSMVTYLSGITNVNPFEYKLPFERFLNPERPSAPDIDMDYADNRRDEMIEYARKKYGEHHVAQIGTFGTMMARGAVRDVARAMGYPYGIGDRIAKLIPFGTQGFPMSIDKALETTPELTELYKKDSDTQAVIDMAKKIEGCARHISIHAAGVVISPVPLDEIVPVQFDPKESGKIITQYDMHSVEDAGLLKFDFLGIRNLSILSDSARLVERLENKKIDLENIPLDDEKTFGMLGRGETMGLFQLNGGGMTRYLKELRPTSIHDINAMVALYRPGPMESIPEYIARKREPSRITYLDPRLQSILDQSYGVLTYQDDVLLIAIHLAGYSWLEADKLRKAMGKKIPEEMEAQKEKLLKGFVEYGKVSPRVAETLWKLIEPFAAYGFNKAHAASYGRVAYQTSYMKANFPGEYMTAVLTADSGDLDKVAEIITECKRMGIPVLPPDINESYKDFTLVRDPSGTSDKIRFGLGSIKNFGEGIAQAIIEERKRAGKFQSLAEFLERVQDRNLNKKSLEALIYSGTLDGLGERGHMLANIEVLLAHSREHGKHDSQQSSLFSSGSLSGNLTLRPAEPLSGDEKLRWEKELLGLYVSGHPLDKFKDKLAGRAMTIQNIKETLQPGMIGVISGLIEETKPILTRKGDRMVFARLVDFTGAMEVVFFPRLYNEKKDILEKEKCVAVKGKISNRDGELSMAAEAVKEL